MHTQKGKLNDECQARSNRFLLAFPCLHLPCAVFVIFLFLSFFGGGVWWERNFTKEIFPVDLFFATESRLGVSVLEAFTHLFSFPQTLRIPLFSRISTWGGEVVDCQLYY